MNMTRRDFLKTAAAVTAGGMVLPDTVWGASTWAHRVTRVHNPLASFFDIVDFEFIPGSRESYYGNFVSQKIVDGMFDAGLCAFTGEKDPVAAMKRLIPYKAGEKVFIKINTTTTYEMWKGSWDKIVWDPHYNDLDAIAEPINALLRALTRMGIPQELIGLGDASWSEGYPDSGKRTPRLTPDRLAKKIKAAFPKVVLYRSSSMADGNGISWTSNNPSAVIEFRDEIIDRRKERVLSHRVPDQLIEAAHFINMPIMKRHDSAGVTGALKNNFGTICSCAYFHEPRYNGEGKQGAMFHDDKNPTVDIWMNSHVGAKTRLIVTDAIFAGWNWGSNPPTGWQTFGGRSPNCLLFGTDPVAMDSVIFDHVTEGVPDKVNNYPAPAMLIDGARVGLGVMEHRVKPKADYKVIDYQEIEQPVDPDKLREFKKLQAAYRAMKASQTKELLEKAKIIAG